ncbi:MULTISPECIES: hypothetical protein [Streptosporangium]|uniref:Nitroreductase domain-containing protein n=1 Tax=Streptosporangium brasiliense TaxID=47480 RepID=A0ABT9RCV1_9ACTN|nr:hypothetical protein [Streptosporangium brasiliense]MDP9867077.1 hypothetical protein [Streptosporangium brasiliense]
MPLDGEPPQQSRPSQGSDLFLACVKADVRLACCGVDREENRCRAPDEMKGVGTDRPMKIAMLALGLPLDKPDEVGEFRNPRKANVPRIVLGGDPP